MIGRFRWLPMFFRGTIIDIETNGLVPENAEVITLGLVSGVHLKIFQRTKERNFRLIAKRLVEALPRPFYAFNKTFEEEILRIRVDRELQMLRFEKKRYAIAVAGLQDPFDGDGGRVIPAWNNYISTGNTDFLHLIMDHNEACLLSETCLALIRWKGSLGQGKLKHPSSVMKVEIDGRARSF